VTDDGLSAVARGGIRSLIFRVLTGLSDFLVVFVTARGFGAEGRGVYTLTSFTITSIVILIGGPQMPMRAEIGRKRASVGSLQAACVAIAAMTLLVAVLVAVPAILIIWHGEQIPVYAALATPFLLLTGLQVSLYQAQGDVRRMSWVALAASAVPLSALTVIAIVSPGDIQLAMLAWASAQFIVPFSTLQVQRRQARFAWHGVRPLLKRLIRRGIPVSVANGLSLVGYRVNLVVVAALLSVADAGRYSIAIVAGELLFLATRALLTGAYAPIISSDLEESVRVTLRTLRHSVAVVLPMGLLLGVGAFFLAGPVLGSEFSNVWYLVLLLVPGFLAVSIEELLFNFFIVRLERTRELLYAATASLLINLAAAAALVSLIGLPGASIGTSIAYCASAAYLLYRFSRLGGPRAISAYIPSAAEFADYRRLLFAAGSAFSGGRWRLFGRGREG
jgi:O-antigen/teichoic acid export membrane protein